MTSCNFGQLGKGPHGDVNSTRSLATDLGTGTNMSFQTIVGELTDEGGTHFAYLVVDEQLWKTGKNWLARRRAPWEPRIRCRLITWPSQVYDEGSLSEDDLSNLNNGRFVYVGVWYSFRRLEGEEAERILKKFFADWD